MNVPLEFGKILIDLIRAFHRYGETAFIYFFQHTECIRAVITKELKAKTECQTILQNDDYLTLSLAPWQLLPRLAKQWLSIKRSLGSHTSSVQLMTFCYQLIHFCSSANKASVSCLKNNMVIAIPKYVLRGADREHIRALNVSCTASENLTHFFLDVPLTSCGTKKRHTISSVVYTNEALPVPPMLKDVVSHVPDFQIPFHCYYDNNGVVTSVGLKPFSKKVIFSKKGFGRFVIKLTLFPDMRFDIPHLLSI